MPTDGPPPTIPLVVIHSRAAVRNVKRFGVNIGHHDRFGAAQLLKNLIVNPGFEAGEFATIFLAEPGATGGRVQADNWNTVWNNDALDIGQPPGFWANATYEIVDGAAKGRRGVVGGFAHENNRYTHYLREQGPFPRAGDVFFLRKALTPAYSGERGNSFHRFDPSQARPGSPGVQSLQLLPPTPAWRWSYDYVMDSYGRDGDPAAGRLLRVEGEWQLEFWARSNVDGATLEVRFERATAWPFLTAVIPLRTGWQHIVRRFSVAPGRDRPGSDIQQRVLHVRLRAQGGAVWVDDMALGRADHANPTAFSDAYVTRLRELRPGILRNWGHQLGSSLDNQLAPPFARKMTGFSPRQRLATQFHFSLHEFLELCREIEAEPWYVMPPTWSAVELQNLAAYLAAQPNEHPYAARRAELGQAQPWTAVFPTIHLEYGNEMWGSNLGDDPFLGATVRGGERLGRIACDRLRPLRSSPFFERERRRFNVIIGGQANAPARQGEIARSCDQHDAIALAPYYGRLDRADDAETIYRPLYARPQQDVTTGGLLHQNFQQAGAGGRGARLAVYELNFHTTDGAVSPAVRNAFVSGLAGGLALPLYMLYYLRHFSVRDQAAFTSVQFSMPIGGGGFVRLWGLLRDLEETGRKRPGWLALELVNRAVMGDLLDVTLPDDLPTWVQQPINGITRPLRAPALHVFPFHDRERYAAVLFNLDLQQAQPVQLRLPRLPLADGRLWTLTADAPDRTNETDDAVVPVAQTLTDLGRNVTLTLPPHSLTVLEWQVYELFFPFIPR